jgi:hypothetical protein
MFIDDNDDDYKVYQKQFRKLEIEKSEANLVEAMAEVEAERTIYEEKYQEKVDELVAKQDKLDGANNLQIQLKAAYYKANMEFLGQKAEVDAAKYRFEAEE